MSSGTTEDACDDSVRHVDVGFVATAGVRFHFGWGDVLADARYRVAFNSVIDGVDGRFRHLSLLLGLAFGL